MTEEQEWENRRTIPEVYRVVLMTPGPDLKAQETYLDSPAFTFFPNFLKWVKQEAGTACHLPGASTATFAVCTLCFCRLARSLSPSLCLSVCLSI